MSKNLVIVESPAKCKTITEKIGGLSLDQYLVSFGMVLGKSHLLESLARDRHSVGYQVPLPFQQHINNLIHDPKDIEAWMLEDIEKYKEE